MKNVNHTWRYWVYLVGVIKMFGVSTLALSDPLADRWTELCGGYSFSTNCSFYFVNPEVFHDTTTTERTDSYVTRLLGNLNGGPTLFDQFYSVDFADPTVQEGILSAQTFLTGLGAVSFTGPTLTESDQTLLGSTTSPPIETSRTSSLLDVWSHNYFAPVLMLVPLQGREDLGVCAGVDSRDLPGANGGPALEPYGCSNSTFLTYPVEGNMITVNYIRFQHDIDRTIITTENYLNRATYLIVGHTAAVPEPGTFALLAVGFLGIGFTALRRRA